MTRQTSAATRVREAESLQRAGRVKEALAAYGEILERWPDLAQSWYNFALLQRQTGRFDEALNSYQQALDRRVTRPEEVHLNRSVIFSDHLHRPDAAESELNAALRLNPRYLPALLNLASLKEECADRDAALRLYERALAIDPNYDEALARLATLREVKALDDPILGRLRRAIERPLAPAANKASLGFALGKILDANGAYDDAFAAYARANRDSRESASGATYDRARHAQLVTDLIDAFASAHALPSAGDDEQAPIFICGMFRSGSTLAEQVLASHRSVTPGGELPFIPAIVRSELAPFPAAMARTSSTQLGAIAANYRRELTKLFPGADRVTDKRPDNFLYVGLIKALFPNARIVNTVRDPLDTCLSIHFLHLDHSMSYAFDLLDTAHYYGEYRRLMAHWKVLFPDDIFDFDYDKFVRQPRAVADELLAFCRLEWDDACLSFHQAKNIVKTESVWQVRTPLYQRSSGRWRHYAKHVEELRAYLSELEQKRSSGSPSQP